MVFLVLYVRAGYYARTLLATAIVQAVATREGATLLHAGKDCTDSTTQFKSPPYVAHMPFGTCRDACATIPGCLFFEYGLTEEDFFGSRCTENSPDKCQCWLGNPGMPCTGYVSAWSCFRIVASLGAICTLCSAGDAPHDR